MGFPVFLSQNPKKGSKIIEKALPTEAFFQRVSAKPKYLIKPMENPPFRKWIPRCEKACKTNGILALFGPKSEKGVQNIGKALPTEAFRFPTSQSQNTL